MSKKSRATTCISRDNENEGNISIQNYESNAEVSIETMTYRTIAHDRSVILRFLILD